MKKESMFQVGLNDILFDVEKTQVTEFSCNSDYAYDIFAYPNGEKLRVNSCSDRYELIPNAEIFPKVRQILVDGGIQFTEKYYHINNARFYSEYVIEDKRFAYPIAGNKNDIVKPMLKVQHSYNGLTKYMVNFGYYRLVCSNGLVIPISEMKEYNLCIVGKHTKEIQNSLQKLSQTIEYFSQNAVQITLAITAKYDTLAGKIITNIEDRITEVLNVANISIIENQKLNTVDYVKNVISSEINLYGGVANDWLIYNGINRYIYDNTLNIKAPEKRAEMDLKVFETLLG
jgi:hypothetical protein